MSRLVRANTVQRAVRQYNTLSKQTFSHAKRTSLARINLSNTRQASSKAASDGTLLLLGFGALAASSALTYKLALIGYQPKKDDEGNHEDSTVAVGEAVEDEAVNEEDQGKAGEGESEGPVVSPVPVPESGQYVIIGGGTAATAAGRAIRRIDPVAKVLVIGEEEVLPYMRPPLSKELWFTDKEDTADTLIFNSWDGKERSVFFESKDFYTDVMELSEKEEGGIGVLTGKKVTSVDAEGHTVTLSSGEKVKYDQLLIATGGKPKKHAAFDFNNKNISKRVTLFRNVSDFRRLDSALKGAETVAVVGGGFLGSELACALAAKGKKIGLKVSQIYNEEGNMAKVLPKYLSEWTTRKVQKEGVTTVPNRSVVASNYKNGKITVELDNGDKVQTDHVIICVGIEPNTELAESAGLEIDPIQGGFRVNSELEARSDIWVAGDAACFYDINLGRRRVEHHDHAVVSGKLAGENMTGAKKVYRHQSMFWSDLGPDVGYEAIGLVDSSLPTVGVWAKATSDDTPKAAVEKTGEGLRSEVSEQTPDPASEKTEKQPTQPSEEEEQYGKGVVFYMNGKKIVGVLLWNIFSQMPVARKIISESKEHEDLNATAKLFKIFT